MKTQPASINDIAKALGISASTVSRALRGHPDINADTRHRVQEFARKVNYRPNALALGLKHQRSFTLGIIIPEIIHHFFSSIISGIEEIAYSKGYRVMICQSNEDFQREVINLQALIDHRVDGLLVSHSKTTENFQHFFEAAQSNLPIVFIDRFVNELNTDKVITDDFQGACMVTSHLIERGRKNIIHLAAPTQLVVGRERHRGYLEALKKFGLQANEELVFQCDTPAGVMAQKDKILKLATKIDSIFAVNDFTAIAAMKIIQEAGYKVPDHIAVAGFGDDPIASIVKPSLTTVEQKGFEMGMHAVKMLIERIEQPRGDFEPKTEVFPVKIIVREST